MALKYVVKKRVFGFDKTKTEKYVAQNVITNTVNLSKESLHQPVHRHHLRA